VKQFSTGEDAKEFAYFGSRFQSNQESKTFAFGTVDSMNTYWPLPIDSSDSSRFHWLSFLNPPAYTAVISEEGMKTGHDFCWTVRDHLDECCNGEKISHRWDWTA
jgi:hypothetical protein